MRSLSLLLFLSILLSVVPGCGEPQAIDAFIVNDTQAPLYLESPVFLNFEIERDGEWADLLFGPCARPCGLEDGPVRDCSDFALAGSAAVMPPSLTHAILSGDDMRHAVPTVGWVLQEDAFGECKLKVPVDGRLRTTLCSGAAVVSLVDGSPVKPPAQSGVVGDGLQESVLLEPACETFEMEIEMSEGEPMEMFLTRGEPVD